MLILVRFTKESQWQSQVQPQDWSSNLGYNKTTYALVLRGVLFCNCFPVLFSHLVSDLFHSQLWSDIEDWIICSLQLEDSPGSNMPPCRLFPTFTLPIVTIIELNSEKLQSTFEIWGVLKKDISISPMKLHRKAALDSPRLRVGSTSRWLKKLIYQHSRSRGGLTLSKLRKNTAHQFINL